MIKENIGTATTIEQATTLAVQGLNAPADCNVQTEIQQHPQKKTFGLFGGKPAIVRAWYEVVEKKAEPVAKMTVETVVEKKEAAPKKADAPSPKRQNAPKKEREEFSPVSADDEKAISDYILVFAKGLGLDDATVVSHEEDEGEVVFDIKTEQNYGAFVGRHGETLDSVQYLVRLFANRRDDKHKKVSINVGDYRDKRAQTLQAIAKRSAAQVLKYGRNAKLDPMNPFERRIVHTTIQGIEGVTSHSVGYDEKRRVIISLEEGVEPTRGGSGYNRNNRNNNRSKGNYNNRNNGGYSRNNSNYQRTNYNEPKEQRKPKSDFAGSRYGKIEVKKDDKDE